MHCLEMLTIVADPSRPKTLGFIGSEDYIRLQFEEYVLSLVSAVKYHLFLEKHTGSDLNVFLPEVGKLTFARLLHGSTDRVDGDPAQDFNMDWVDYWKKTENFRIFQKFTGIPPMLAKHNPSNHDRF